jgi:hypothetical protein
VLVSALGATLVGFILLVAALISGVLWLAIACIVVCVIGVGFLLADLLGIGRKSAPDAGPESESDPEPAVEPDHGDLGHQVEAGDERSEPEQSGSEESGVIGAGYDDDPPTEEIHLDKPR